MQISQNLINTISAVFLRHGIDPETITWSRLISTGRIVTEKFDGDESLSQLIFDKSFPRAPSGGIYYHYTTIPALNSIIKTGEFRLYSLSKRLSEDEFRTFCLEFGLDGYTTRDDVATPPMYHKLCNDLFYTSLAERDSPHLWNVFGDQGRGARIGLKVDPVAERCHLRYVRYGDHRKGILMGDIDQALEPYGLAFVPRGLSRYAAFYLPDDYSIETEVRLLAKRMTPDEPWDRVRRDENNVEYLPVSIDAADPFCKTTIAEVVLGDERSMSALQSLLEAQPAHIRSAELRLRSDLSLL